MVKNSIYIILFAVLTVILFFIGLDAGSFDTDIKTIREALFSYDPSNKIHFIILHLRMPRILLAFLVGGSLSLSGYLMQAMVNNPLAEPYILGTASGASLGAN